MGKKGFLQIWGYTTPNKNDFPLLENPSCLQRSLNESLMARKGNLCSISPQDLTLTTKLYALFPFSTAQASTKVHNATPTTTALQTTL